MSSTLSPMATPTRGGCVAERRRKTPNGRFWMGKWLCSVTGRIHGAAVATMCGPGPPSEFNWRCKSCRSSGHGKRKLHDLRSPRSGSCCRGIDSCCKRYGVELRCERQSEHGCKLRVRWRAYNWSLHKSGCKVGTSSHLFLTAILHLEHCGAACLDNTAPLALLMPAKALCSAQHSTAGVEHMHNCHHGGSLARLLRPAFSGSHLALQQSACRMQPRRQWSTGTFAQARKGLSELLSFRE